MCVQRVPDLARDPREREIHGDGRDPDRRDREAYGLGRDRLGHGGAGLGCRREADLDRTAVLAGGRAARDVRPDDRAARERAARRELELVAGCAANGTPGEGRRARERALRRLVRAQLEAMETSRDAGQTGLARGCGTDEDRAENGKGEEDEASRTHRIGCRHGERPT